MSENLSTTMRADKLRAGDVLEMSSGEVVTVAGVRDSLGILRVTMTDGRGFILHIRY